MLDSNQKQNPAIIGPITAGFQARITTFNGNAAVEVIAIPAITRWSITFLLSAAASTTISPNMANNYTMGFILSPTNPSLSILWKDNPLLCTDGWKALLQMGDVLTVIEELRIQG